MSRGQAAWLYVCIVSRVGTARIAVQETLKHVKANQLTCKQLHTMQVQAKQLEPCTNISSTVLHNMLHFRTGLTIIIMQLA